jgi:hypothetical protein
MKALMLLLALAFAAACSAPTSTEPVADPGPGPSREETVPTCRSGYAIANRNGEWVCEPIEEQQSSTSSETGS